MVTESPLQPRMALAGETTPAMNLVFLLLREATLSSTNRDPHSPPQQIISPLLSDRMQRLSHPRTHSDEAL